MIDQLMRTLPMDQLAGQVGADEGETRRAVQSALPALLGGLARNSQDRGGAESLLGALGQHQDGLADDPALDRIDTQDGEKILGHIFGGNTDGVVNQLGGLGGGQSGQLVRRLLPILAPIVLSWLAKQVGGAGQGQPRDGRGGQDPMNQEPLPGQGGQGGQPDMTSVLQDVLGGALGGATGTGPRGGSGAGGGGILGDVLGGLLGGGRR